MPHRRRKVPGRNRSTLKSNDLWCSGTMTLAQILAAMNTEPVDALVGDAENRGCVGLMDWLGSVTAACCLVVTGSIRLRHDRLGSGVVTSDDRCFTPFRETVKSPDLWTGRDPAVLVQRFRLRAMQPGSHVRHAIFRRVCIVMTPLFVGVRGFRSKLWMYDAATGEYARLYEWDDVDSAQAYAEGLCEVVRLLPVPGSVSYELIEGCTVDVYLDRHEQGGQR